MISSFLCFGNSSAYWLCCSLMDRTHHFFSFYYSFSFSIVLCRFWIFIAFSLFAEHLMWIDQFFQVVFFAFTVSPIKFRPHSLSLSLTRALREILFEKDRSKHEGYIIYKLFDSVDLVVLFCFYLSCFFFRFSYWPTIHPFKCLWLRQASALRVDIKTESTNWKVKWPSEEKPSSNNRKYID